MFKKISAVLDQIFWRRKKVIWHLFIVWKVFWAHYIIYWKKFDAKYFSLKEQIWWISITLFQVPMAEICWKVRSFPLPRCRNILSGQKGKIKNRYNIDKGYLFWKVVWEFIFGHWNLCFHTPKIAKIDSNSSPLINFLSLKKSGNWYIIYVYTNWKQVR